MQKFQKSQDMFQSNLKHSRVTTFKGLLQNYLLCSAINANQQVPSSMCLSQG